MTPDPRERHRVPARIRQGARTSSARRFPARFAPRASSCGFRPFPLLRRTSAGPPPAASAGSRHSPNFPRLRKLLSVNGRSLTGARIETCGHLTEKFEGEVAPSRERGSKRAKARRAKAMSSVAPSRERGSKRKRRTRKRQAPRSLPHGSADRNLVRLSGEAAVQSRSLTGARIETCMGSCSAARTSSRSLTGARIETYRTPIFTTWEASRSLTGARIETSSGFPARRRCRVAPSRERGSKLVIGHLAVDDLNVAPSRERGSKQWSSSRRLR